MPDISEICPRCGKELGWAFGNFKYIDGRPHHIICPTLSTSLPVGYSDREELIAENTKLVEQVRALEGQNADLQERVWTLEVVRAESETP